MSMLTNWHVKQLIKNYNERFNKAVKWVDLTKLVQLLSTSDTEQDYEDLLLVEKLKLDNGVCYFYIGRAGFEACIIETEPTMEISA